MRRKPHRNWVTFTRRTDEPKLTWLERQLDARKIPHRRNGFSWHAPILEVPKRFEEDAWQILPPAVDDLPDNHRMFTSDKCLAFLLCTNRATTTLDHPILGLLSCCERCKRLLKRLAIKNPRQATRSPRVVSPRTTRER